MEEEIKKPSPRAAVFDMMGSLKHIVWNEFRLDQHFRAAQDKQMGDRWKIKKELETGEIVMDVAYKRLCKQKLIKFK